MKKFGLNEAIQSAANIGVVLGILFLVLEIQQNTDAIRSATIQDISRWSYDSTVLNVEYPELRAARRVACAGGELTDDQRDLLTYFLAASLRIQANRFYQARLGILDEASSLALGGRGAAYRLPIFREVWNDRKEGFDPEFQQFIEQEVLPLVQARC